MKNDAEAHADDDRKTRELIDAKNKGDALAFQIRKQLEELGDKVATDIRGRIESALSTLEQHVKGDDAMAIERAIDELQQHTQELAKIVYEQQAAESTTNGGDQGGSPDNDPSDDVIDAEYKVKD